jgi:hypothetical protein
VDAGAQFAGFWATDTTVARAYAAAERAHRGQVRELDRAPFIVHPVEVARVLHAVDAPTELVVVGLLHDAVEKQGVPLAEIRSAFGDRVAGLVEALTDDTAIVDFTIRKSRLLAQVARADDGAIVVLAADKIAKARELWSALAARPLAPDFVASRRAHYLAAGRLVRARLPGHRLAAMLDYELDVVGRMAARARARVGSPSPRDIAMRTRRRELEIAPPGWRAAAGNR